MTVHLSSEYLAPMTSISRHPVEIVNAGTATCTQHKLFHVKKNDRVVATITEVLPNCVSLRWRNPKWDSNKPDAFNYFVERWLGNVDSAKATALALFSDP